MWRLHTGLCKICAKYFDKQLKIGKTSRPKNLRSVLIIYLLQLYYFLNLLIERFPNCCFFLIAWRCCRFGGYNKSFDVYPSFPLGDFYDGRCYPFAENWPKFWLWLICLTDSSGDFSDKNSDLRLLTSWQGFYAWDFWIRRWNQKRDEAQGII